MEDAAARTVSRVVCDKVGNRVTVGPIGGNKIDKQAPGITIGTPASAGVYKLNQDVRAGLRLRR